MTPQKSQLVLPGTGTPNVDPKRSGPAYGYKFYTPDRIIVISGILRPVMNWQISMAAAMC